MDKWKKTITSRRLDYRQGRKWYEYRDGIVSPPETAKTVIQLIILFGKYN